MKEKCFIYGEHTPIDNRWKTEMRKFINWTHFSQCIRLDVSVQNHYTVEKRLIHTHIKALESLYLIRILPPSMVVYTTKIGP